MKIFITGSVGSGKTTLVRLVGERFSLPVWELDSVVYCVDDSTVGNHKRPPEERDALFMEAMAAPDWVMEDAGRSLFEAAWQAADQLVLLEPSPLVRDFRILRRWIRQKTGREKCNYCPNWEMLRMMFKWRHQYDKGGDHLRHRLADRENLVCLRTTKEVQRWLDRLEEELWGSSARRCWGEEISR